MSPEVPRGRRRVDVPRLSRGDGGRLVDRMRSGEETRASDPSAEHRAPSTRLPIPGPGLAWALLPLAILAIIASWLAFAATLWKAYAAFLVLLCGLDCALRPARRSVRVERILEGEYRVGRPGRYQLRLENTGRVALRVSLREVLPVHFEPPEHVHSLRIAPGESLVRAIPFLPTARGRFQLSAPTLRVRNPIALFAYQETARAETDELLVSPGRPSSETTVLIERARVLEEAGGRVVRRRGHDSDFESLRDYVVGDDIRLIDWKATARRAHPQVRQFQMEQGAEVILALDCGRLMGSLVRGISKLDLAITPVLDLAGVAVQRGERVGLVAFDSRVLASIPPRGGARQVGHITEALAGLETSFDQTSFTRAVAHLQTHHKKRSLVVVFTDFTDEISSRDLQLVLTALSRRHVLVFVAVGDPHLEDIIEESPRGVPAAFQKAAAAELALERRRVIHSLNRAGVLALDGHPFELSGRLINRYLEARARL